MAALLTQIKFHSTLSSGADNASGKVYTYAAGTTTPQATYTDQGGGTPNANPVILDSSGRANIWLASGSYYKFVVQDSTGASTPDGTVDNISADLSTADLGNTSNTALGDALVGVKSTSSSSQATTQHEVNQRRVSLFDFMTSAQKADAQSGSLPTVVSTAAFSAMWASVKPTGGNMIIPPGNYSLDAQWLIDPDLTLPHNYKITGYGATLFATSAVTGFAVRVYSGFNNFGVVIEGLAFNHRNNVNVAGCIQAQGSDNLRVVRCACENYNTKAGYTGIELGPYTIGTPSTNSIWSLIDGWTMRQRTGGEGTVAAMGIRLFGAANATHITNCALAYCTDAIRIETDGSSAQLANGVLIDANNVEQCTNAITINTAAPATFTPLGLRVYGNRCETTTTFVNFTGAAVTDSGAPPYIGHNYLVPGSVTNHLVNANNQLVYIDEPTLSGVAPYNKFGGPVDFRVVTDGVGHNVVFSNASGNSSYQFGHLVLGSYHIWVNTASGTLYIKNGVPTTATDGTVVGVQVGP